MRIPRRTAKPATPDAPAPPPSVPRTSTVSLDDLALPSLAPPRRLATGSDPDLGERRRERPARTVSDTESLDQVLIAYLFDLD